MKDYRDYNEYRMDYEGPTMWGYSSRRSGDKECLGRTAAISELDAITMFSARKALTEEIFYSLYVVYPIARERGNQETDSPIE